MSIFKKAGSFLTGGMLGGQASILGDMFGKSSKIRGFDLSKAEKNYQNKMYQQMLNAAQGKGPSAALMQQQQAFNDIGKQASSMAASSRGVSNPFLAQREAMQMQADAGQEAATQGALLRAQEQARGTDQLAGYLAARQGQAYNQAAQQAQNIEGRKQQLLQFGSSLGQAAVAKSDEKMKKDIKEDKNADKKIDNFLEELKSYVYKYKDEKHGKGEKSGVMAQDLEKSEIGEQMVEDTPEGKVVNYGQGFGALLAAQARLNEKLEELNKKIKK